MRVNALRPPGIAQTIDLSAMSCAPQCAGFMHGSSSGLPMATARRDRTETGFSRAMISGPRTGSTRSRRTLLSGQGITTGKLEILNGAGTSESNSRYRQQDAAGLFG